MKIFFTGGGTAGHVYPALAVHEVLTARYPEGLETGWIGSSRGPECQIAAQAGIPFYPVQCGKLRRYLSLGNFTDVVRIGVGFFQALRVLADEKPDLLFSKGGFVSVPPAAAARVLGIPVITHESDVTPGLATKIIARFARRVLIPFEESRSSYKSLEGRCFVTGNPVRKDIRTAEADPSLLAAYGADDRMPTVLVLGGSQGAMEINELIRRWAEEGIEGLHIIHQTGEHGKDAEPAPGYRPVTNIGSELGALLRSCSLVISRAGAGALWEIAAAGRPMILIPKTDSSSRGDQLENARQAESLGAAVVLAGEKLNLKQLKSEVFRLIEDEPTAQSMVQSAAAAMHADGAERIADHIEQQLGLFREGRR